jgi:hypothetical protein
MAGHPELTEPRRRSELRRLGESMRSHHTAMLEQDKVIATRLRRNRTLHSIIGRTGAYRVGRQFSHAAGLNAELARTYRRAAMLYEELRERKRAASSAFVDD